MNDKTTTRWTLKTADGEYHTKEELTTEQADARFAEGEPPVEVDKDWRVPTEKITAYQPKRTYYVHGG